MTARLENIKLRDKSMDAENPTSDRQINPYIQWTFDGAPADVTVYTDLCLEEVLADTTSKVKIAWLIESPKVNYRAYRKIKKLENHFDLIFTCSKKLLKRGPLYTFIQAGCPWVAKEEWGIHEKAWNVSIMASQKAWLKGQKLRHKVIKHCEENIDSVLLAPFSTEERSLMLECSRYSIIIENTREDFYFTEKILDCFLMGVIPVYWGCPSMSQFFDTQGIISFKNLRGLKKILKNISEVDYLSRIDAVKRNYELALAHYLFPEAKLRQGIEKCLAQNISSSLCCS